MQPPSEDSACKGRNPPLIHPTALPPCYSPHPYYPSRIHGCCSSRPSRPPRGFPHPMLPHTCMPSFSFGYSQDMLPRELMHENGVERKAELFVDTPLKNPNVQNPCAENVTDFFWQLFGLKLILRSGPHLLLLPLPLIETSVILPASSQFFSSPRFLLPTLPPPQPLLPLPSPLSPPPRSQARRGVSSSVKPPR